MSLDVLDAFYEAGKDIIVVSGNMDNPGITNAFPSKHVLKIDEVTIGIIHGWGSTFGIRDRIRTEFSDVQVIVYGHTHQAFNQIENGILFFNPGSPTDTRFTKENSIGIIYVQGKNVHGELIVL
ncbi:MAG: YfcE family phosphodiesterase [Deltaproteobacteria bacterium]|nr:MAG: YfcE family phosphodiesterase [Deltaproteobacteria bacterium]